MLFEENKLLLAVRFPHLESILNTDDQEAIKVEACWSKTGVPVPRLSKDNQQVYLNSIYDPELEAERWVAKLPEEENKCLLLIGGGFLYHLKALLQTKKYKKIICYEPSPEILRACLNEIDLKELMQFDWLLISGPAYEENIVRMTRYLQYMVVNLKVEVLPSYTILFNSEIAEFNQLLKDKIRIVHVNLATANITGERWILNAVENLKHAIRSPGISYFFDQFKGIPAIIISGGPSLEKNIHLLNGLKEKAVLICVGSSVRAASKKGIWPHFLVNIDGNPFNSVLFNELDLSRVYLLYNIRSYPEMLDKYAGPKIHMKMDVEQFSDMITFKSGGYDYGLIRSGFSCAHSGLDVAYKFGCNPIILIGQDLAYTDRKRYADGQADQVQKYVNGSQLPPGCMLVKDINGRDVVTDHEFQSFRIWFEQIIEEHYHDVNIINATEGGQPIKGAVNRPLAEVIAEYCQEHRAVSWKIQKYHEKGKKALNKYGSQALCIPSQLEFLMNEALVKIDELINRVQELRKLNFIQEYQKEKYDAVLKQIMVEYEAVLNYREYEVLLLDLRATKLSVNYIKMVELGEIDNSEKFDAKLVHVLNILNETRLYLEHIKESNQKSLSTGEIEDAPRTYVT